MTPKGSAYSYLLDTYSGSSVAYSLRKLSSTYSGNCIRVRRSSDNTEQNIGFVSNVLDTTSLLSFVGAGNGFVTTWYDQSGNGVNMIQTAGGYQPIIVSSGILLTSGGKPILDLYYKNMSNTMSNTISQSVFTCYKNETTLNGSLFTSPFCVINNGIYGGVIQSGSSLSPNVSAGTSSYYINNTINVTTRDGMYTNLVTGTNKILNILNGGSTTSGRLIQYDNTTYTGNFKVFESIIYPTDKTSIKTDINTNINTYYGIY